MVFYDTGDENYNSVPRSDLNAVLNDKSLGTDHSYKHALNWGNIVYFIVMHTMGIWGFGILLNGGISSFGFLWAVFLYVVSTMGVTMGAHRYYSHRAFKATPPLRAAMVLAQTLSGEKSIYVWVREHRLHHRHCDTDADPHNSNRGFFFSHIGWVMSNKHPNVIKYGKNTDLSDIEADWMVMFQVKHYLLLYIPVTFVTSMLVPVLYFGDTWLNSFLFIYVTRYLYTLHCSFLINSAAHMFGTRPYDKNINPVESWFVSFSTLGEGWHNYHHTFPWDYKAAELPMSMNLAAILIRFFEKIGLAYDLQTVPQDMVNTRIMRTGDGTHFELGTLKRDVQL